MQADAIYRARELTYYYDHEGCLVMKARMPADQGEVIINALEKITEDQYGPASKKTTIPTAARRVDALCETGRRRA